MSSRKSNNFLKTGKMKKKAVENRGNYMVFERNNQYLLRGYLEQFFLVYVVMQPFLDLTAFVGLPISDLVRLGAMGLGLLYLWFLPSSRKKHYTFIYLIVLILFFMVSFINNFLIKDSFFFILEGIYLVKTFYFILMLLVYAFVLESFMRKRDDWLYLVKRNVSIALSVIGFVMLAATLTETGRRSYGALAKEGHSGWFYSANDLSSALAIACGFLLLYILYRKNMKVKLAWYAVLILTIWSMLTIGTKVALGGAIFVLAFGGVMTLIGWVRNKMSATNVLLIVPLAVFTLFSVPYMPVGANVNFHLLSKWIPLETEKNQGEQDHVDGHKQKNETSDTEQAIQKELLSGRGDFLQKTIKQYKQAPLTQKLFGMGRGGNYESHSKQVEMDFFDWFFNYGIIGFLLLMTPLVYYGIMIFRYLFTNLKALLDPNVTILGVEIGIGLGVAFFAGHVLTKPASSIYLALLIASVYVKLKSESEKVVAASQPKQYLAGGGREK